MVRASYLCTCHNAQWEKLTRRSILRDNLLSAVETAQHGAVAGRQHRKGGSRSIRTPRNFLRAQRRKRVERLRILLLKKYTFKKWLALVQEESNQGMRALSTAEATYRL